MWPLHSPRAQQQNEHVLPEQEHQHSQQGVALVTLFSKSKEAARGTSQGHRPAYCTGSCLSDCNQNKKKDLA